ncbi:MAG: hypothetical protein ACRED7_01320 [Stellaceae bacterium]
MVDPFWPLPYTIAMPDFSLGKLLVLALIVGVAWYGWKYAQRVEQVRRALKAEIERRRAAATPAQNRPAEDLVKCSACGIYVPAHGAHACGCADCPWPR